MKRVCLGLLLVAYLGTILGHSEALASDSPLIAFKPIKARSQVNQRMLTMILSEYYQQSYRAAAIKPATAVAEISQIYKRVVKRDLPLTTRIELAQVIKKYQSTEGKQVGFENTRGLASTLPSKRTAPSTDTEEELE